MQFKVIQGHRPWC